MHAILFLHESQIKYFLKKNYQTTTATTTIHTFNHFFFINKFSRTCIILYFHIVISYINVLKTKKIIINLFFDSPKFFIYKLICTLKKKMDWI